MTKIVLTWRYVLAVIVVLLVLVASYWLLNQVIFSLDSQDFDRFITQFGPVAPLVMIGLIAAEVIIAPLPGGWLSITTGYIFGSSLGFIYAYIGSIVGSAVAFELARWLGQPFVRKFVDDQKYQLYSAKLETSKVGLGLLYAIPLFPVDIVCLLLGASGIRRRDYYLIMLGGLIPNMLVLNFVGAGIAVPEYRFVLLILVAAVIAYFVWKTMKLRVLSQGTKPTTVHQETNN
jgi:uncharacterized membrane protein YdjX (TVP38/TMEM64 family)